MSNYQTLLVTTDFSEPALHGVKEGARLAKALGTRVVFLYVVEDRMPPVLDRRTWTRVMSEHRDLALVRLEEHAAQYLEGLDYDLVAEVGQAHEVIVATARERSADLIVMASHGYGLIGKALLGSTTDRVLRHAECPVVVVRED